ncbi:AraC family transcriptional regulator [Paraburkholderia phosphatilytica]|uniref:AraC family transcriptional regulator n=1 Tax=Paraburkholderia phosphatilytica TaxID=2282883 RepID=UPI000E4F410A|nr:AraC family transcriptional regulator [Paraburkholderia phosphatilytica]
MNPRRSPSPPDAVAGPSAARGRHSASVGGAATAQRSPAIAHSRFSTATFARGEQALAWRQRVGHVVDMLPTQQQLADGFYGEIERYAVGDFSLTDARTDAILLDRPVARVSTDGRRDYAFHVYVEGESGYVSGMQRKRSAPGSVRGIVALDLNQPFSTDRAACRVLTLFVPEARVHEAFADGESLHGRIIEYGAPLTNLAFAHLSATFADLGSLDGNEAMESFEAGAQLLLAAYRKDASLTGAGRAAMRVAVMGQVRRYVEANLHDQDLTPTSVVDALQLKRATIYRWFEHEGGLGTYIRNRRLREAARELAAFPHLRVAEIAYGLGFKSPSDFTRAFRRAFDISPQDMREQALSLRYAREAA